MSVSVSVSDPVSVSVAVYHYHYHCIPYPEGGDGGELPGERPDKDRRSNSFPWECVRTCPLPADPEGNMFIPIPIPIPPLPPPDRKSVV